MEGGSAMADPDAPTTARIVRAADAEPGHPPPSKRQKKKGKGREFDYDRYHERHVAFRVAYIGARYHGFASQGPDDVDATVEGVLFDALRKVCLVKDRATAAYSRCGRTDAGVSAFGQVIALNVRSNLTAEAGAAETGFVVKESAVGTATQQALTADPKPELNYVHTLNRILPDDVLVTAWSPVPIDFNARFSASSRSYKYFFLLEDMDLARMRDAAARFIGEHDFRNFCKMDIVGGVTNYRRRILSVTIDPADPDAINPDSQFAVYCINVRGLAFLWHQIRCMAAVLFMVGRGDEEPAVVSDLLDIESNPCKPQYTMASDLPLVLYDCEFPGLEWRYSAHSLERVGATLHAHWRQAALTGAVVKSMIRGIRDAKFPRDTDPEGPAVPWHDHGPVKYELQRPHIPLMSRPRAETLETKLEIQRLKDAAKEALAQPPSPNHE